MRKTSLIDRKLFKVFNDLIEAVIDYCPEDFDAIQLFVEQESAKDGQPALRYHISCPTRPETAITEPDERIGRAGHELADYFTQSGSGFPGFRIMLQRQASGHWKNDIKRLDTDTGSRIRSPLNQPDE